MRPILLGILGLACTGAAAMAEPAAGPVPLGDDELGRTAGGAVVPFPPAALPAGLPPEATLVAQPYLDRANAIITQAHVLLTLADQLLATPGTTPPTLGTAGAPTVGTAGTVGAPAP